MGVYRLDRTGAHSGCRFCVHTTNVVFFLILQEGSPVTDKKPVYESTASLRSTSDLLPPPPIPPTTSEISPKISPQLSILPVPEQTDSPNRDTISSTHNSTGSRVMKRLKSMAQSLVSLADHRMVTRKKSQLPESTSSVEPKITATTLTASVSATQIRIKRKCSSVNIATQKKRMRISAPNIKLTKFSAINSPPVLRSQSK